MQFRKQKETEFHNKVRDIQLKKNTGRYKYLTSNKKFYSIVRKSQKFVNNYLIQNCSGKRVLDYCCGNGGTALFLAKYGANAVGIDISDISIKNAKEETLKRKLDNRASFYIMDAEDLKFKDDYFDLIICNGVLHHLNVKKAYPELARVLKQGGKIICDEPLTYNPIFQLYRKMTPQLRTKWEMHHILGRKEIKLTEKYFGEVETKFFHLATLLAVPFHNLSIFNRVLAFLEKIDSVLLKIPGFKWLAWQIVFTLSKPKKYGTEKTRRN